jgi:nucleotide-binding universal stress UspA family protein
MYKHLLVPIDGSESSMLGLAEAIRIARSSGARLHLLHVVDETVPFATDIPAGLIEQFSEAMRARGRETLHKAEQVVAVNALEPESVLLETVGGRAADLIVDHAKQCKADLIVMGTHGRRGIRRLALGSDAELVVRSSPVPVLLVRGPAK